MNRSCVQPESGVPRKVKFRTGRPCAPPTKFRHTDSPGGRRPRPHTHTPARRSTLFGPDREIPDRVAGQRDFSDESALVLPINQIRREYSSHRNLEQHRSLAVSSKHIIHSLRLLVATHASFAWPPFLKLHSTVNGSVAIPRDPDRLGTCLPGIPILRSLIPSRASVHLGRESPNRIGQSAYFRASTVNGERDRSDRFSSSERAFRYDRSRRYARERLMFTSAGEIELFSNFRRK